MLTAFLSGIVAPVFCKLFFMSITALVVGMIIILIRRFADKRFSPFWKHTMWVLVLIALILPWRMQSDFALMNTTEKLQDVSFSAEYTQAHTDYETIKQNNLGYSSAKPLSSEIEAKSKMDSLHVKMLIFDYILPAIWLFGVIIIGMFMLYNGLRLGRKIKKSTIQIDTQRYEKIMQNCRQKLVINRSVDIFLQSYVKTPALFGLIIPKIILPTYVEHLSDEHLEYVILHELSHLKRLDGILNTLLLTLQTVYWFNPLTWLLFKFIREDMELANDASVLKNMSIAEQKEYCLSLIEVLAQYGKPSLAPRLLCMVDNKQNMERRIHMIKLGDFFKKRRLIIAASAVLVITIIATLFLTVGESNTQKYKIAVTSDIIDRVESISTNYYSSKNLHKGFIITASKIHAAYKQNDKIRVFVTTYYCQYFVESNKVIEGTKGFVPAAITYDYLLNGNISERAWSDYVEAKDGSYWRSSIENFCKLPNGQKIDGLAQKIVNNYGDNDDLEKLEQKNFADYIDKNGLSKSLVVNNSSVTSVDNNASSIPSSTLTSSNISSSDQVPVSSPSISSSGNAANSVSSLKESQHYKDFLNELTAADVTEINFKYYDEKMNEWSKNNVTDPKTINFFIKNLVSVDRANKQPQIKTWTEYNFSFNVGENAVYVGVFENFNVMRLSIGKEVYDFQISDYFANLFKNKINEIKATDK